MNGVRNFTPTSWSSRPSAIQQQSVFQSNISIYQYHLSINLHTIGKRHNFSSVSNAIKNNVPRSKRRNQKAKSQSKDKNRRRRENQKQTVASFTDPSKIKGPHGRPLMTERRFLEHEVLQDTLGLGNPNHSAKNILNNARQKMHFDMTLRHKAISNPDQGGFIVTSTISFANGELASYVPNSNSHPHIVQRIRKVEDVGVDADTDNAPNMELVCMGAGQSKKVAERLAAADTIALLYEIGIDARDPPDFRQERMNQGRSAKDRQKAAVQLQVQELFKADLAQAQMILEMFNCSRPQFEVDRGPAKINGNLSWTATVSSLLRGQSLTATGAPAPKRSEAEGMALIELAKSEALSEIVGSDVMDTYKKLIDASPGQHIASLRIQPMSDDMFRQVNDSVGTASDQELRTQRHCLAKDEYENYLRERQSSSTQMESRDHNVRQQKNQLSLKDQQGVNNALKREEEERLREALENPNGRCAEMKQVRDALPIKKIQQELVEALRTEQVIVISGGTGSGKSTQCPQYIIEDAIANDRGADTTVIVTQPRRIAAVSVAERVAAERGESIGNSIGYTVRFKRQPPRECGGSVEFCTTGVLLRRLINDSTLTGISHVMIDEVHERDINTDFLLVLLRDLLKERPDLRVVLMSATLDAESFSEYFSREVQGKPSTRVPLLSVPTQPRHPVEVFYLEDLKDSSTGAFPVGTTKLAQSLLHHNDAQLRIDLEEALAEEDAAEELHARSRAEDEGETLESDSNADGSSLDSATSSHRVEILQRAVSLRDSDGGHVSNSRSGRKESDKFDSRATVVELVTKVARQLCEEEIEAGRSGSILCFLPGWDEIKAATEELEKTHAQLKSNMTILPLHSTIPHDDQQKVFLPASGKMKVILSTNIAESSITIDDVLAVIDSGLVREMNFDAESALSAMETNKTSKASATQRLGRAGRVAPGKCYRLYSRGDFEAMPPRPTPEIQRTALEATCLQTSSMTTKGVEVFLGQALDPPPKESVSLAMDRLVKLGAINVVNDDEVLSPLGQCLSRLPLDPAIGRMLMMGVVMKCLDPLLTSAACFSSKSTFYNPPGMRDEAQHIRKSFSDTSDIMASVRAYDKFWRICNDEGWASAREWAFGSYVNIAAMVSIKAVRSQLLDELNRTGMISKADLEGRYRKQTLRFDADVNKNADNEKLCSALWATGFPGNLAARRPLGSFGTLRTRMESHTGLHPSSVIFHRKPPQDGTRLPFWYLYREMVLSSQVFLRDSTMMEPEQILLFGGYVLDPVEGDKSKPSRVRAVLDDWIVVEGPCAATIDLLARARKDTNLALEHKVMFPKASLPAESQEILDDICELLDPSKRDDDYFE